MIFECNCRGCRRRISETAELGFNSDAVLKKRGWKKAELLSGYLCPECLKKKDSVIVPQLMKFKQQCDIIKKNLTKGGM